MTYGAWNLRLKVIMVIIHFTIEGATPGFGSYSAHVPPTFGYAFVEEKGNTRKDEEKGKDAERDAYDAGCGEGCFLGVG